MRRALLLILLLALAPAAQAAESAAVRSPRSTVALLAEPATIAPGVPFRLALRLQLAPGWHSYWLNPGDAGAPPEVTLSLPAGAAAGPLQFPTPARLPEGPLVTFGYTGEVLLPILVTPPAGLAPGDRFTLTAEANWLACAEICVPEEGRFALDLPVGAAAVPDAALAPVFAAAEAALPRPPPWPARAAMAGGQASLRLEGPELSPETVREAFFFPAGRDALLAAAPQPLRLGPGWLTLALARDAELPAPESLDGVLLVTDAAGLRAAYAVAAPVGGPLAPEAVAASVAAQPAAVAGPASDGGVAAAPGWAAALGLALLGGLVLNLMPCVFPVLAMKAMGLARLSGAPRARIRAEAASTTAGVLVSFGLLGGALIGLRAAGVAAGWGFQFTAPGFVAAMAWLLLAVGLNLSGVFAVGGPVLSGGRAGHLGSFLTGALAVLVATPCTAPFMAAALGAALALPAAQGMGVFLALGLGLAAPMALLGLAPGLARLLPRPGAWMERLRQALAFPMYGAAAWLVWVLAQQAGPEALLLGLGGAVLVGFAGWALGVAQGMGMGMRSMAHATRQAHDGSARAAGGGARGFAVAGGLALLAALALLPAVQGAGGPAAVAGAALAPGVGSAGAEPWSAGRVAALQAAGRPVFVNLTAAWCITCKVNERIALRTAAVEGAFAARQVATLVGDWSRGDAAISALLRAHGREGVPMYLLYPAGGGAPRLLPEVLTEGIVLRALESLAPAQAGGEAPGVAGPAAPPAG